MATLRYLRTDQQQAYLAELRPELRVLMVVLLGTGVRLSEALRVRVRDLSLQPHCGTARVQSVGGDVRSVFVPAGVVARLEEWIEERGLGAQDRLFHFLGFDRRSLQREHRRAAARIGTPEYTLRDHRHSFAVAAAQAGIPLPVLHRQLGNRRTEQTLRYAPFHPDHRDDRPDLALMEAGRPGG